MRRQGVEKLGIKEFTLAKNQRISPWVHRKQGIFLAAQHLRMCAHILDISTPFHQ
jgi:hypothetical protein